MDMNGKTQTVRALGGAGSLNVNSGNLTVSNGGDFGGVIAGDTGTVDLTGGTLTLTGENTFTGATTVASGSLQIGNGGTTGVMRATSPMKVRSFSTGVTISLTAVWINGGGNS